MLITGLHSYLRKGSFSQLFAHGHLLVRVLDGPHGVMSMVKALEV
jgi:hypothetical protein